MSLIPIPEIVWALDDVAFMLVEATVLKKQLKLLLKFCLIPNSYPENNTKLVGKK